MVAIEEGDGVGEFKGAIKDERVKNRSDHGFVSCLFVDFLWNLFFVNMRRVRVEGSCSLCSKELAPLW